MEIKIEKVELSITNNGTVKAYVYPEGSDINNIAESIEIIGDECIYLATRKKGDTIIVETKGKWKNVVIEDDYKKALQSPQYDRIKLLFKRAVAGMNKLANGDRTELDFNSAKILMSDKLDVFIKTQDYILSLLKGYDTAFAKKIVSDFKSKDIQQQYNSIEVINKLTQNTLNDISKEYRVINDCEDIK